MKTKITLGVLALICMVSLSVRPQTKPQAWEYKFDLKCSEKRTNEFAAQGWEPVMMSESGGMVSTVTCVFKRAKL